MPPIELYVLQAEVGGHPVGSSVSRQTLERHGYFVPPLPLPPPWKTALAVH